MWLNSAHDSKTLAIRGQGRVAVKENTAASRERYTILTKSWTPRTTAREELLMPARRDVQAGGTRVTQKSLARAERAGEKGVARAVPGDDAGEQEVARAASSVGGARSVPAAGPDSLSAMSPPIAVLFRSQSETGARIRRNLKVPP